MSEPNGSDWQQIIWREWRNCNDRKLADQLFPLVAGQPVGPGTTASMILLGAFYGMVVGLLVGLFVSKGGALREYLPDRMALVTFWLVGGGLGAALGLIVRSRLGPHFSWWQWLERLSPQLIVRPPLPNSWRRTMLAFGFFAGFAAGPLGGLVAGLFVHFDFHRGANSSEKNGSPRLGELIFFGVVGSLFGGLVILAVAALAFIQVAVALVLFLLLTVQGIALSFGVDLGLLGGLLFGLVGGLLGGVLANLVAGPTAGLVAGLAILLVNGVVSLVRTSPYVWRWRGLWAWWHSRPDPWKVELALQQARLAGKGEGPFWSSLLGELARKRADPGPIEALVKSLSSKHWRQRFLAAHTLASVGGEAVPMLQTAIRKPSLSRTSAWLLRSIANDTRQRLAPRLGELLCPHCLVRFAARPISVPGPDLAYYGCRVCGQSRDLLEWPGEVVAVLDKEMSEERAMVGNSLRVNWFVHHELFDFDRVEVVRASDEEVELFAVQVGNDTDPLRRARYPGMVCHVVDKCDLAENTRRILERVFGRWRAE